MIPNTVHDILKKAKLCGDSKKKISGCQGLGGKEE